MTNNLEDEMQRCIERMENEERNDQRQTQLEQDIPETSEEDQQPIYTVHTHYFPDAIVTVFPLIDDEKPAQIVDSEPAIPKPLPPFEYVTLGIVLICCLPTLASILFQVYVLLNPPIAIVTIIPKSQLVTLTGSLQIGRVLQPITISQSQTVPTTGKGHQDARNATGTVTFYNGQQTEQTIAQGTVLTGNDGVRIETTQSATIPPGSPSSGYGTVLVSTQALQAGIKGNIQAGEVNTSIGIAVFVKNNQFTGGQDERNFQSVAQSDILNISRPLQTAVTQSMQGTLQGQLKPPEHLTILPCYPTVTSDHQPGQEAIQVEVTVSQTCRAVAYNSQDVAEQATAVLSSQALQHIGAGYSVFGKVHVSMKQATIAHRSTVLLSFSASGTWVYGLSKSAQERLTHLLAGKTTQAAVQLLATLPGVEQATIRFKGFGDETRLPRQSSSIYLAFVVM